MSDTLTTRLVHPTAPVLLTKNGPLGTIHSRGRNHGQTGATSYSFRV